MQDDDTNPHADYFTPGVTHAAPATFPRPAAAIPPPPRVPRFAASGLGVEPELTNPLDAPEHGASGVYAAVNGSAR